MMFLSSKEFWSATIERAIKSAAQGAITGLGADAAGVLRDVSSVEAVAVAALAMALLSVLTSLATAGATDGSPSATSSEVLAVPGATADPVGGEPVTVEPLPGAIETDEPGGFYIPERAAEEPGGFYIPERAADEPEPGKLT